MNNKKSIFRAPFPLREGEADFPGGVVCLMCVFWGVGLVYDDNNRDTVRELLSYRC